MSACGEQSRRLAPDLQAVGPWQERSGPAQFLGPRLQGRDPLGKFSYDRRKFGGQLAHDGEHDSSDLGQLGLRGLVMATMEGIL